MAQSTDAHRTSKPTLAEIRQRDADSAATWFKEPALGACGRAFIDRRWLLERLAQVSNGNAAQAAECGRLNDAVSELKGLLHEAVKIVHCHARNTDKDWLLRARALIRKVDNEG